MRKGALLEFFRLVRSKNLLIVAATQYFTAIFLISDDEARHFLLDPQLFLLVFSTLLIAASGYIINDYYDIKIDLINKPGRVVLGRSISRRAGLFIHTLFNFLGIFLGILIAPVIGLIHLSSAFWLWIYSNQLKRIALVGNVVVSILTGATLILVAILYNENYLLVTAYAVLAMAITLIRELIKDMEDAKGDSLFGANTFPIVFGLRNTKRLLYVLIAGFVLLLATLAYFLKNEIFTIYMVSLFLPAVYFVYRLTIADKVRDYHFLSSFCKVFMLSGIFSMIFF